MNHKLLRSRRVVHKGEFTQLQGQRQRQPIIIYIRVFLFNLNCDYSNSLFSIVGKSIREHVFTTPIKRRAYLDVSRRNRAGTTKKNCDTELDATKRRNAENGKWKMGRKQRIGNEFTDRAKVQDTFCFNFHLPVAHFSNIRAQLFLRLSKKSFVVFHMALAVGHFAA